MRLQLNESKFRNILTEMVKEVLLLMEATPLEKTADQCKDILQYYIPFFKNNPETLDFIYKQFINTYFHGNSNNIVGKLSPIFLHLVWYFNGFYLQNPTQQDRMFLSKVKEMIRMLSIYASNKNTQYQNELNDIKINIKQILNGTQINTDELPITNLQKKVINRFLAYYNQLVRQNNQPKNIDDLIDQKIQGNGVQYPIIDEIFNTYKSFTINTTNNSNELPQYEELFMSLETKCNEAKKEINTTTTINNSETTTNTATNNNTKYVIMKIHDMEEAWEYGQYSGGYTIDENGNVTYEGELCFTNNTGMWNTFTNNKTNTCYLLLDKGLSQNPNIYCTNELSGKSSDNPYDDYGMSMIFLFVTPEGVLSNSNTRWNHRADYSSYGKSCDNAFTEEDIQRLISPEVYKNIFTNILNDKINELNNGKPLKDVFQIIKEVNGYTIIEYKNKYNLVYYDKDNVRKILWYPEHYSLWFTQCNIINDKYIILNYGKHKFNIFDTINNSFVIDTKNLRGWFDRIDKGDDNNLFRVRKNDKYNYLVLDNNGEYRGLFGDINNTDEWFEWIEKKDNNLFKVTKNNKENYLVPDGNGGYKLVYGDINNTDTWFDEIIRTNNNLFKVEIKNKENFLVPDKVNGGYKLVYGDINNIDEWFDWIEKKGNNLFKVEKNNKENYVVLNKVNGEYQCLFGDINNIDEWFDDIIENGNLFWIRKNFKENCLLSNGKGVYKLVFGDINNTDTWFDRIDKGDDNNLFRIQKNDKYNYLVPDGNGDYKLVFGDINNTDIWFDDIREIDNDDLFRVKKNNKTNLLAPDKVNGDYKLVFGDINNIDTWFDNIYEEDDLVRVKKNNKMNFLVPDKVNGSYKFVYGDINNTNTWFDIIYKEDDLFFVRKNGKENYLVLDNNGDLQCLFGTINNSDTWFDCIDKGYDNNSFWVNKNGKHNYLVPDGNGGYKLITPDEYKQYRNQQNQPLNEIINRLVRNYIRY